eukprot:5618341-Ditylum_brightwellii.AAC.1
MFYASKAKCGLGRPAGILIVAKNGADSVTHTLTIGFHHLRVSKSFFISSNFLSRADWKSAWNFDSLCSRMSSVTTLSGMLFADA